MTDSKSLGDSVSEYDSESKVRFLLYRLIILVLDLFNGIPSSLIESPALVYQPTLTLEIICGLEP
jgi:hypothetical protein